MQASCDLIGPASVSAEAILMTTSIRLARHSSRLTLLVIVLAFSSRPLAVLADYDPITGLDTRDQRLLEKKQELQVKHEKIVSENDRLYNEVTSQRELSFFQEHMWEVILLGFVFAVLIRLLFYRREKQEAEPAAVEASASAFVPLNTAESGPALMSAEPDSKDSYVSSFLAMMGKSSHFRRRSRSGHHRHRRRSR
jgi:hypothetical protein